MASVKLTFEMILLRSNPARLSRIADRSKLKKLAVVADCGCCEHSPAPPLPAKDTEKIERDRFQGFDDRVGFIEQFRRMRVRHR